MELSPQAVAAATFRTSKKGYDPQEVRTYLAEVSKALESAQQHATSMEARARAAVSRLQEMTQSAKEPEAASIPADDAETISRTLLLAQRTADATVSEARSEADALLAAARAEAATLVAEARRHAASQVDEARTEARRALEGERVKAENEVQALVARREFLLADVEHLEEFAASQRRRLEDTATLLREVAERAPGGLGEMRRPLLSAAADAPAAPSEPSSPSPAAEVRPAAVEEPSVVAAPTAEPTPSVVEEVDDLWADAEPTDEVLVAEPLADEPADVSASAPAPEVRGYEDTAPTPTHQPGLLDFDTITAEMPVVRRAEAGEELTIRKDP